MAEFVHNGRGEPVRDEKISGAANTHWPWCDNVWSVRTLIKVGTDGRVPIGTQRLRVEKPPGSRLLLCLHPSGHHSVLAAAPDASEKPRLLFTDRSQ